MRLSPRSWSCILAAGLLPAAMGVSSCWQPDPARGLDRLQHGVYQDRLLCSKVFDELHTVWDGNDRRLADSTTDIEVIRAIARSRYGFGVAPYDNGGAPLGLVASGNAWHLSCLTCHAGYVPGLPAKATIGVANNRLDFLTFLKDITKYAATHSINETCGFTTSTDASARESAPQEIRAFGMTLREETATSSQCGNASVAQSRGTTNAFILSASYLQHRDADLERIDCVGIPGLVSHPLDAPAWWTTARKSRFYSDAFAEKNGRALLQFAMSLQNSGSQIRAWEHDGQDMLAWIDTQKAPRYPFPLDAGLAATGRTVFESNCSRCHGTYGGGSTYPAVRAIVGTDELRLTGLSRAFKERYAASWLGHYGKARTELEPAGYLAPPLDGVWATAPYFHNGAVPTLAHVLDSSQRPVVWRVKDFDSYDQANAGLLIDGFAEIPPEPGRPGVELRRFIDTTRPGMSRAGHTFGDHLTPETRRALIEYLKSL